MFRYLLVIVLMQCLLHSIVIGFLSRTLPDFGIIRNLARLWNIFIVSGTIVFSFSALEELLHIFW